MERHHAILQVKVYRVANLMINREQAFFKQFEITQKQFNMLRILRGVYPNNISMKDLKERMIDKSSDLTRLANRLIKKELISLTTNQIDKRYRDAAITKAGMNLLAQIDQVALKEMKTGIEHLNEQECQQLSKLLDKIAGSDEIKNDVIVK